MAKISTSQDRVFIIHSTTSSYIFPIFNTQNIKKTQVQANEEGNICEEFGALTLICAKVPEFDSREAWSLLSVQIPAL